jgi:pilus assembly protein CpaB
MDGRGRQHNVEDFIRHAKRGQVNRRRLLIVLLLALMSGGLAGYSALQYLRQRPTPLIAAEPARRGVEVVVAARDLPLGHFLTSEDVVTWVFPTEALPAGWIGSIDQAVGRGLLRDVRMYEPLLDTRLGEKGLGGGLPIVIPEGMRALTVRVDEVVGVAGFVRPQTRVDVILTIEAADNQPISRTILQNVTALAGGQDYVTDETGRPVVVPTMTLLVSLEDAEKLTLAASQGRIQLALRNMLDLDTVRTQGARVSGLLQGVTAPRATGGGSAAPVTQQVQPTQTAPRRPEVELLRGANRSIQQYGP